MTLAYRNEELHGMVDYDRGVIDRRIFSDREIYQLELERIYARAWNFMCHDSQIPNPGDFFMTFIGEDRVIVVRDNDGLPQVLINSCRHRGNAVCRAEEGHATSFMCTYHGWTYDLKGALVGVPGFKEVYHEELDRENWGLIKAAQVDTYKSFIFATMDPEAPGLHEFLGEVGRISIDFIAERGDMIAVGGVSKYVIPCNWKFAVDNVWDYYHSITHQSATMSGYNSNRGARRRTLNDPKSMFGRPNIAFLGEYGHAIGGPQWIAETEEQVSHPAFSEEWRKRPEAIEAMTPAGLRIHGHPNIFPNMWVTQFQQVSMRMPKGPSSTEIWWWSFVERDLDRDIYRKQLHRSTHTFGAAGMLEQDDGENWGQSTRGMVGSVTRHFPLNYAMHKGLGKVTHEEGSPPYIESPSVTEHPQLWHYRNWADWMAAESWADLKANHTPIPDDTL
jgi:phenylpropionate dioxygenase-like ring-hydroxylating dioxygenase large terminal subunit